MMGKLLLSVAGGIVLGILAYQGILIIRPHVSGMSSQEVLWNFYTWAGWWWWGIMVLLGAVGLAIMFTLPAPEDDADGWARFFLYVGLFLHCLSWGNNALGPLGNLMVLCGVVVLIGRRSRLARRTRPRQKHAPLSHQVLSTLTGDVIVKK